ncbi:MAG: hypothetical protein RJB26_2081 [Pseudomonadota bacterium]|jgi:uncharacterized membrane protein
MKMAPATARRYATWLLLVLVVHAVAVWAMPRLIMRVAMSRLGAGAPTVASSAAAPGVPRANDHAHAVYPPLATAASRVIVLPSPDLGYALCLYDLSRGHVDIDAAPQWPAYWSVALYADNTDNFLVRNDRAAGERPVHWRLALSRATPSAGRELIVSPSARGLVLLRVLVANREEQAAAVAQAQRALHCRSVG